MKDLVRIFICLLWFSCSAKSPEWLQGSTSAYPFQRYMIGVGSGDSVEIARDNARAEISKIFKTYISSTTNIYTKALTVIDNSGMTGSSSSKYEEITRSSTDRVLEGVVIVETYHHEGVYYALAVLDRHKSLNGLTEAIGALDDEIETIRRESSKATDKVTKIKLLKKSIALKIERETQNSEFKIVGNSGVGIPSETSIDALTGEVSDILYKDFRLGISIEGDFAQEIASFLQEGLTGLGFVISNEGSDIIIVGSSEVKRADRPGDTFVFVRYLCTFDLKETKNGQIIGTTTTTGREGHTSLREAEQKALRKMATVVTKDVSTKLSNYIFGTGTP